MAGGGGGGQGRLAFNKRSTLSLVRVEGGKRHWRGKPTLGVGAGH